MTEEHDIAYTALQAGSPVRSSDGHVVGTVANVLTIPDLDLFDGIVIQTPAGTRFVDADQIPRITTAAVYCNFTADVAATLPVPDGAPTLRADSGRVRGNSPKSWIKRLTRRPSWKDDDHTG
jgi:hypothetical protein